MNNATNGFLTNDFGRDRNEKNSGRMISLPWLDIKENNPNYV